MEYRRFADTWVVRMDRGEEIVGQLQALASREQIRLAEVSALGAVGEFTVGVYHPSERQYASNTFTGDFEIVSLTGTVTEMDGRAYLHLHMSAGDGQGRGGHQVISGCGEEIQSSLLHRLGVGQDAADRSGTGFLGAA